MFLRKRTPKDFLSKIIIPYIVSNWRRILWFVGPLFYYFSVFHVIRIRSNETKVIDDFLSCLWDLPCHVSLSCAPSVFLCKETYTLRRNISIWCGEVCVCCFLRSLPRLTLITPGTSSLFYNEIFETIFVIILCSACSYDCKNLHKQRKLCSFYFYSNTFLRERKMVKRLLRRRHDPEIIEKTICLVLGLSTTMWAAAVM